MSRKSRYEEKIRIRARKAQRLGLPSGTTYPIIKEQEKRNKAEELLPNMTEEEYQKMVYLVELGGESWETAVSQIMDERSKDAKENVKEPETEQSA